MPPSWRDRDLPEAVVVSTASAATLEDGEVERVFRIDEASQRRLRTLEIVGSDRLDVHVIDGGRLLASKELEHEQ
jgi:hypothetical protein